MHATAKPGWHSVPVPELVEGSGTDAARGLDRAEAARRLASEGPNELRGAEPVSPLAILAAQFRSVVVWVLLAAALVSAALGEATDAAAIVAIVALNAAIGFFQEFRADRAIAALARLSAPHARVVRGGESTVVPSSEVVRGDLLLLEAGDLVAADARLLAAERLRTVEASLTGESQPVDKRTDPLAAETPLAERSNMLFLGTSIATGTARAVVVATGMATEMGRIATLLESASGGETPLQRRLDVVARQLLRASLAIVALVFVAGLLRGMVPGELFLAAVSLAVAAIPEGLPAVVTVALAVGVSRMIGRNALIRRLSAVETLGCAEVICTDKTGTLTVGQMTARNVATGDAFYRVTGEGWSTDGEILAESREAPGAGDEALRELLLAAAACNDAELVAAAGRETAVVGDPTEAALLVLAAKGGERRERIEERVPRLGGIPFDSERKRMTVVRERDGAPWAFLKGAPEVVLERSSRLRIAAADRPFDDRDRDRIAATAAAMAAEGLRVLAFAERRLESFPATDEVETDLVFLGLVGLQDPPRPEAREAVARSAAAGIRTVMITGDHPDTARAIARELGILRGSGDGSDVLLGRDLDALDDASLRDRVPRVAVYARVTAEHKLRIVRAWKARGAVVAMTGDGVNDAPALKEASIGIAMGISGTEVTKQAADMVVTDDNYASIVAAVEEGRGVYDNIAKTLSYLLAGNAGELLLMLVAVAGGWPLPLLPVQLLWINLVTDGLPALALATDRIDPDVLARPPRRPERELVDRRFLVRIATIGALTSAVAFAAFLWELGAGRDLAAARNASFSVLVFAELLRAFGARSETKTLFEVGIFSNFRLFAIVAASFALQLFAHHVPLLERLLAIGPVSGAQCVAWTALGLVPLAAIEAAKLGVGLYRAERGGSGAIGEAQPRSGEHRTGP